MPRKTKDERDEQTKKQFFAGVELRDWRERHALSDDDILTIMAALGWAHLTAGYQQRKAASVITERRSAVARENGKKGGRPRKAKTE